MKNLVLKIIVVSGLAVAMAVSALAGPGKAPVAPKCPVCHMTLSTKKTAADPVPVKIGKKTYYCCKMCNMQMKGHTKMTSVMTKTPLCPICHMPLSTKMTKEHPVAVRLSKGGKAYYCCSACKMPNSVLVHPKH